LEPCVELCRDLDLTNVRARTLQLLGIAHLRGDNLSAARAALAEGVPAVVESGDRFGISLGLGALVMLALATSRPRLALRLTGVRDEFERFHEVAGPPPLRLLTDQLLAPVRSKLGAAVSDAVRDDGRAMTVDEAVAAVLADDVETPWQGLTRRETEVAGLVAAGLTNREIAERLVLSLRTVETHIDRILTKLGFRSRGQLTAWAHEHGLMAEVEVT
jgi:non-specific serine/threonine protein kinase